jgi:hypothetical protein
MLRADPLIGTNSVHFYLAVEIQTVRNLAVKRAVKVGDVRSYQLKREP